MKTSSMQAASTPAALEIRNPVLFVGIGTYGNRAAAEGYTTFKSLRRGNELCATLLEIDTNKMVLTADPLAQADRRRQRCWLGPITNSKGLLHRDLENLIRSPEQEAGGGNYRAIAFARARIHEGDLRSKLRSVKAIALSGANRDKLMRQGIKLDTAHPVIFVFANLLGATGSALAVLLNTMLRKTFPGDARIVTLGVIVDTDYAERREFATHAANGMAALQELTVLHAGTDCGLRELLGGAPSLADRTFLFSMTSANHAELTVQDKDFVVYDSMGAYGAAMADSRVLARIMSHTVNDRALIQGGGEPDAKLVRPFCSGSLLRWEVPVDAIRTAGSHRFYHEVLSSISLGEVDGAAAINVQARAWLRARVEDASRQIIADRDSELGRRVDAALLEFEESIAQLEIGKLESDAAAALENLGRRLNDRVLTDLLADAARSRAGKLKGAIGAELTRQARAGAAALSEWISVIIDEIGTAAAPSTLSKSMGGTHSLLERVARLLPNNATKVFGMNGAALVEYRDELLKQAQEACSSAFVTCACNFVQSILREEHTAWLTELHLGLSGFLSALAEEAARAGAAATAAELLPRSTNVVWATADGGATVREEVRSLLAAISTGAGHATVFTEAISTYVNQAGGDLFHQMRAASETRFGYTREDVAKQFTITPAHLTGFTDRLAEDAVMVEFAATDFRDGTNTQTPTRFLFVPKSLEKAIRDLLPTEDAPEIHVHDDETRIVLLGYTGPFAMEHLAVHDRGMECLRQFNSRGASAFIHREGYASLGLMHEEDVQQLREQIAIGKDLARNLPGVFREGLEFVAQDRAGLDYAFNLGSDAELRSAISRIGPSQLLQQLLAAMQRGGLTQDMAVTRLNSMLGSGAYAGADRNRVADQAKRVWIEPLAGAKLNGHHAV